MVEGEKRGYLKIVPWLPHVHCHIYARTACTYTNKYISKRIYLEKLLGSNPAVSSVLQTIILWFSKPILRLDYSSLLPIRIFLLSIAARKLNNDEVKSSCRSVLSGSVWSLFSWPRLFLPFPLLILHQTQCCSCCSSCSNSFCFKAFAFDVSCAWSSLHKSALLHVGLLSDALSEACSTLDKQNHSLLPPGLPACIPATLFLLSLLTTWCTAYYLVSPNYTSRLYKEKDFILFIIYF